MRARLECRCLAVLEAMCTFRLQISRKPKTWLTLDNSTGMSEYLSQIHVFLSFVQGHSDSETLVGAGGALTTHGASRHLYPGFWGSGTVNKELLLLINDPG